MQKESPDILIPCPICGSHPYYFTEELEDADEMSEDPVPEWRYLEWIECDTCGIGTKIYTEKGKAAQVWNCRASRGKSEIVTCSECRYASITHDGQCKYCSFWDNMYDQSQKLYLSGAFFCAAAERRQEEDPVAFE